MLNESSYAKIKVGRLYRIPNGNAVRVVRTDWSKNLVIFHNCHSHSNDAIEYTQAAETFVPLLKIGEVAKLIGRKSATLRKYENLGLLPSVEKISLSYEGKATTRVYSPQDIEEIVEFFDRRRPAGRPYKQKIPNINKIVVKSKIDSLYIRGKKNG